MPGRNGSITEKYRYGFNGMEVDPEVSGGGNSYTTQFRQYDPRLGRWKSLDPLAAQFPWQSPFCGMDNNPIVLTDPLGLSTGLGDGGGDGSESNPYKKGEFDMDDLANANPDRKTIYYTEGGLTFKAEYSGGANGQWTISYKGARANSDWTKSSKTVESNYAKQNTEKSASVGNNMKKKSEADCADCEDQQMKDGHNDVNKQQFTSKVKGSAEDFERFKNEFTTSPQNITNNTYATYIPVDMDGLGDLSEGDHIDINIYGPDNGSVRVAKIILEENRFELYFHALEGHPDAGKIRFSGSYENGVITFEIYNITRLSLGWYSDVYPFGVVISPYLARTAQIAQWRLVIENFQKFMGLPATNTENIRTFEWDSENQTIGDEIE